MISFITIVAIPILIGIIIYYYNNPKNFEVFKIDDYNYHISYNNNYYRFTIDKDAIKQHGGRIEYLIKYRSMVYRFPGGTKELETSKFIKAVFDFREAEEAAERNKKFEAEIYENLLTLTKKSKE